MNTLALNGNELNGSAYVDAGTAMAAVVLSLSGEGMRGAMGEGNAAVQLAASWPPSVRRALEGLAEVEFEGAGSLIYGITLKGSAEVALKASGAGVRWAMLASTAPVVLTMQGDGQAVAPISATFSVQIKGLLDAAVAKGIQGESRARVVFSPILYGWPGHGVRLIGQAPIVLAGIARASVTFSSPPATASFGIGGRGEIRSQIRHSLEGLACIELYGRGYAHKWHYLPSVSGHAQIALKAASAVAGLATFPTTFTLAPAMRLLTVPAELRQIIVPEERRAS